MKNLSPWWAGLLQEQCDVIRKEPLSPGLRTRSIFNRVRVQKIFASQSSSSSSNNFIFRVRQKLPSSASSSLSSQPWTIGRNGMNK